MEVAKIGKKGQLTIPHSVLRTAGISAESYVALAATADGAIVLRPVAVYPIELYSAERVREFDQTNALPVALEQRVQVYLNKRQKR